MSMNNKTSQLCVECQQPLDKTASMAELSFCLECLRPKFDAEDMKLSLIMPIHNEVRYLHYSLPSIKTIEDKFDELIFVLDNCTDLSLDLVCKWFPQATILKLKQHEWKHYAGESFQIGFNHASKDIIVAWGADLIIPPSLPSIIKKSFSDPKVGTVCFRYYNVDIFSFGRRIHGHYENLYKSLIQKIRRQARHTGVYAIRKKMMDEIGGLVDIISSYDEFPYRAKKHLWKVVYIPNTKILHLRPGLTRRKQYIQGVARYYLPGYNLIKTIFHSFIHFKPALLVGYLHAKKQGHTEAGTLGHT